MMEYSLHNSTRTTTFVLFGKGVIGEVEQFRPGRFRWYRFPKPVSLEKTLKAGTISGRVMGDHILARRSAAIWNLKNAFEHSEANRVAAQAHHQKEPAE